MLKTMRKHAKYFYILFFIVILTFIFWGVGPLDKPREAYVAEIGSEKISVGEFWRAYENTREFYRQIYQGRLTAEIEEKLKLKDIVLENLIEEKVLLASAKELGIVVTDKELQDIITKDTRFIRDGVFRKDVYLKTLQLNRVTPEQFETSIRNQLTTHKMRQLITTAVDISDHELATGLSDEKKQILLNQKRNKAIKAYVEAMRQRLNVKENKDLISS
ncbi:MAG: SurA N-terminal domain-containing protein [Thermodesulfovibrionales bacterium]|nr:SurA N-terminal domain-containing protein [Thermodesulfovibrionales bacterium]